MPEIPAAFADLLDVTNPYRYLELRGDAVVKPDDDYSFADLVGAKYGADLREHDGHDDTRAEVTIRPVRVNALNMAG